MRFEGTDSIAVIADDRRQITSLLDLCAALILFHQCCPCISAAAAPLSPPPTQNLAAAPHHSHCCQLTPAQGLPSAHLFSSFSLSLSLSAVARRFMFSDHLPDTCVSVQRRSNGTSVSNVVAAPPFYIYEMSPADF